MKRIKSKKIIQENYVICNDSYKRGCEEGYKRDENHSDRGYDIYWWFVLWFGLFPVFYLVLIMLCLGM